jgi:phosphoribosyl 1,2-cyclic phosphate phosphodiesterase
MEILLLGTAAAEGWPAPYCICEACEKARKRGGPDVRTRSGAVIDEEIKIDFGPDTVMQMQRAGRHLRGVKTLIFTHHHSDHFVPTELEWAKKPFTLTPAGGIELWGNSFVMEGIKRAFTAEQLNQLPYILREMKAGDYFTTAAGDEVWAMPADHCAGACVLRIRRKGKTIFYGHDTGALRPETLKTLSDGIPLDLVLLDCTYGKMDETRGHMGVKAVVQQAAELRKRGAITERTRVIATHFSHGGTMMYDELCQYFLPHGISVSYDGMVVEI